MVGGKSSASKKVEPAASGKGNAGIHAKCTLMYLVCELRGIGVSVSPHE